MSYVAMYQKFKLIRERNQLELQQVGYSTKLARIEKNITKKEKYYAGLFAKLEQQATAFKNQAKIAFQNGFGLGQGSVNPMNYTGMNGFVLGRIQQYLSNPSQVPEYKDGKVTGNKGMTFSNWESIYAQIINGGIKQAVDGDGNPVTETYTVGDKEYQRPVYDGMSYDEKMAVDAIIAAANSEYQQAQVMMNQATTNYDTNISIWLEAQQAQIQAEQDSVLGALQYEQEIMEIDNAYCEQRLKRIEQEIESYDNLIKDRNEKGVPKFGLG